jgi:Cys-tRNA(Pro) deacylase
MAARKKQKYPVTPAIRVLRAEGADFVPFLYRYEQHSGASGAAAELGVDPHVVIKTLVMEDELGEPLVVLMHGDREVATGLLAKHLGKKRIGPCAPKTAEKHSGYRVGGTSPFGLKHTMPIYAERSIRELDLIWINGGKRGFQVGISPAVLERVVQPTWVDAAQPT